jgi:cell division transport system permease protein
MLAFLLAEALRDLRRAGRIGVSAVLLMSVSLGALGCFWVLSLNLGRAAAQWRERFRVVVYLKEEPSGDGVALLLRRIEALGGIQRLKYTDKREALETLKRELGTQASVVGQLAFNPLPASVEVMPAPEAATPEATRSLIRRLSEFPEVEEVQGGTEWVDRVAEWQRLLGGIGLGVGGVLAVAAILTVTTATTLVLHLRRQEMEIMRLVGASETVIRIPLLLQGLVQGLLGALIALIGLRVAYAIVQPQLDPLMSFTLGLQRTTFLSPAEAALLLCGGAFLGSFGGLLARGRAIA